VPTTSDTVLIEFGADLNQAINDESWAIDNFRLAETLGGGSDRAPGTVTEGPTRAVVMGTMVVPSRQDTESGPRNPGSPSESGVCSTGPHPSSCSPPWNYQISSRV